MRSVHFLLVALSPAIAFVAPTALPVHTPALRRTLAVNTVPRLHLTHTPQISPSLVTAPIGSKVLAFQATRVLPPVAWLALATAACVVAAAMSGFLSDLLATAGQKILLHCGAMRRIN